MNVIADAFSTQGLVLMSLSPVIKYWMYLIKMNSVQIISSLWRKNTNDLEPIFH